MLNISGDTSSSSTNGSGKEQDSEMEMMRNIVFLSREFGFTYNEIIQMPYSIFLSYLRWARQFKLEENPDFMEEVNKNSLLRETEPEYDKLIGLRI